MKVIVATHGDFCYGILDSYIMLVGENDDIIPISLGKDDTGDFKERLNLAINKEEKYIILCDLYGGSPFNESAYLLQKNVDNIRIVTGVNLGMLLEIGMLTKENIDLDDLEKIAVNTGNNSIKTVSFDKHEEEDIF